MVKGWIKSYSSKVEGQRDHSPKAYRSYKFEVIGLEGHYDKDQGEINKSIGLEGHYDKDQGEINKSRPADCFVKI